MLNCSCMIGMFYQSTTTLLKHNSKSFNFCPLFQISITLFNAFPGARYAFSFGGRSKDRKC
jgi:hypothetical protein